MSRPVNTAHPRYNVNSFHPYLLSRSILCVPPAFKTRVSLIPPLPHSRLTLCKSKFIAHKSEQAPRPALDAPTLPPRISPCQNYISVIRHPQSAPQRPAPLGSTLTAHVPACLPASPSPPSPPYHTPTAEYTTSSPPALPFPSHNAATPNHYHLPAFPEFPCL